MKVITARIPEDDLEQIQSIESEEGTDRAEVIRRLISKALADWRVKKALDQLRAHKVTIRTAASIARVTYIEMLDLADEARIDSGYTIEDLERDWNSY